MGWQEIAPHQQALKVAVTAAPENNKANEAIIALIAEHLNVAKGKVRVISGMTSRRKIIEIDAEEGECLPKLQMEAQ